jgi:hypothetical protein
MVLTLNFSLQMIVSFREKSEALIIKEFSVEEGKLVIL